MTRNLWNRLVIGLPFVWLLIFFFAPFLIVFKISLAEPLVAQPPYSALLEWGGGFWPKIHATFSNYAYMLEDSLYLNGYLNSLKLAGMATLLCLLVGYPAAYGIARCAPQTQSTLILLIMLPFWTSLLLRIYALIGILDQHGVINTILLNIGIIDTPLTMMHTEFAMLTGIVYTYLPFMILPLFATLSKMDVSLNEAALDLGSRPYQVFLNITLPLSLPGIIAGSMLVFIPATGEYIIPALLGSSSDLMIGRVVFDEFFVNRDWPVASAVAIVLLILLVLPISIYQYFQG